MPFGQQPPRLSYRGNVNSRGQNLFVKVLAVAATVIALVGAVAISIVLFAAALTAAFTFGIYFWWRTRDLRKQLRTQRQDGDVIEGELVRKSSSPPSQL